MIKRITTYSPTPRNRLFYGYYDDGDTSFCEVIIGNDTYLITYLFNSDGDNDDEGQPIDASYWKAAHMLQNKSIEYKVGDDDTWIASMETFVVGNRVDNCMLKFPYHLDGRNRTITDSLDKWAEENGFELIEREGDYSPTPNSIKYILSD